MKFCLIGEKLGHSYSKIIHEKQGLDYSLVEVKQGEISEFLSRGYDGFNVTIPYKIDIIAFLDNVDEIAFDIGAVNTVVKKGSMLYGYNTDVFGMEYALKRAKIDLFNKKESVNLGGVYSVDCSNFLPFSML